MIGGKQSHLPANPVDREVVIRGSPGRSSTKAPVMVAALLRRRPCLLGGRVKAVLRWAGAW